MLTKEEILHLDKVIDNVLSDWVMKKSLLREETNSTN